MGLAIDTVVGTASNPGATATALTMNTGDSATVRNFANTSKASLHFIARQGATAGIVGARSPRFADAVRGIRFTETETPSTRLLPPDVGQAVYPSDALILEVTGGTAETDAAAYGFYYDDLPGVAAVLKNLSDIAGSIANIKPVEVDVSAQGTSAAWSDTVITTTENYLKADTYYAVLGYTTDTAVLACGVKGPETGNLRICGPGPTTTFLTDDYFLRMADRHGKPYIPVFNANNRAGVFVSTALVSTSATPKVTLVLAELASAWRP